MIMFINVYLMFGFFIAGATFAFEGDKIKSKLEYINLALVSIFFGPIIWLTKAIQDYFNK